MFRANKFQIEYSICDIATSRPVQNNTQLAGVFEAKPLICVFTGEARQPETRPPKSNTGIARGNHI